MLAIGNIYIADVKMTSQNNMITSLNIICVTLVQHQLFEEYYLPYNMTYITNTFPWKYLYFH